MDLVPADDSGAHLNSYNFLFANHKNKQPVVFWAKLQSFPWWPARFASKPEIEALEGVVKSKEPSKQVMVVFLGTVKQR